MLAQDTNDQIIKLQPLNQFNHKLEDLDEESKNVGIILQLQKGLLNKYQSQIDNIAYVNEHGLQASAQ